LQTPEGFRSLASTLLAAPEPSPALPADQDDECAVSHDERENERADGGDMDGLREVRLFYARVTEAVEAAVETLLEDIAADVIGRELLLGPVEIGAIVDRALQRFASEEPLRVRVHPEDRSRANCGIPVVADDDLRPGDAIVELRSGSIDASFGARLAALLQAVR
jgi:flagellar assembly protein FliH